MFVASIFAMVFFFLMFGTFTTAIFAVVADDRNWHPMQKVAGWWTVLRSEPLRDLPKRMARRRRMQRTYLANQRARMAIQEIRDTKRQWDSEAEQRWMEEYRQMTQATLPMLETKKKKRKTEADVDLMEMAKPSIKIGHTSSHQTTVIRDLTGDVVAEYCQTCKDERTKR